VDKDMKKIDKKSTTDILYCSIWFGLLTGLVEGPLLLAFHQAVLLTWRLQNRAIWYETLWIAPLVDVLLFTLLGMGFALIQWIFPQLPIRKIAWRTFLFLTVLDWVLIALFGRTRLIAILILALGVSVQAVNFVVKRKASVLMNVKKIYPWMAGLPVILFLMIQGGGWINEKYKTLILPEARSDAPNVMVIVVDTLRADHLSSYGYQRDTSPFIDSLAREGVLFQNAISASSWTQPSHASMLTGRYAYEHQAENKPLDKTYPTIGELMQANGYRTGAFSGNTLFFTRRQGFGRGFLRFEDNYKSVSDMFFDSSLYGFFLDFYGLRKILKYDGVPMRKSAEDINRSTLSWIDGDTEKPFFVFINYFDVHDPYTPPQPYRGKYASVPNPGGLINGFMDRYRPTLTPEQLQSEIDAYDGSISYVDDQIKSLYKELEQRGLLDNTIVIITADHGESLGEHDILQHGASLYLQEIHVPLIVWGPDYVQAGKTVDVPVSTTSLPATILSFISAGSNPFPRPSLTLLMSNDTVPTDWPVPISEVAQYPSAAEQNPSTHGEMKSVVGNEMQYIIHEKFGEELYNWRSDPQETNNLIAEPSTQSVVDTFRSYLKNLIGKLFK
jgi:arylsulfatase A-like enzyme